MILTKYVFDVGVRLTEYSVRNYGVNNSEVLLYLILVIFFTRLCYKSSVHNNAQVQCTTEPLLPAHASEQGNVIGSVRIYI